MLRSTLIIGLLTFSATAGAQGFDYNWLSLGYGMVDFDEINVDGNGFGLDGSYALNDDYHVFGEFESFDLDFGVDATTFSAGIGYNTEMSQTVDAFARLSYEYIDVDIPAAGSNDEHGFGFSVGLRFAAGPGVELNAGIDYVDYGSGGDDTAITLGGLYNFTPAFALGLAGSWGDDVSSYTLIGRYYFGR